MLKTVAAFDRIGEENAFAVLARATQLAAAGPAVEIFQQLRRVESHRQGYESEIRTIEPQRGVVRTTLLGRYQQALAPAEPVSVAPDGGAGGRDQVGLRMDRQDQRFAGGLHEVEVFDEVAQLGRVFAYIGAWIGPPISLRVEPGPSHKVVFDELGVGVEAERLVVDEPALGVGLITKLGTRSP